MATTMMINSKRVVMSIEEKAKALTVFEINEPNRLAVTSGSEPNRAYVCHHDGCHVTYCPCDARTSQCSHTVAGNWFLEAKNRAAYVEEFGIYA